ncbi:MAG: site-2 protease family protein [Candidatus Aureabacteria bacterium]|nr:site-2 protease family protein [Candidatus Auribacterota bacterium]
MIILIFLIVLFSLSVHEFAHGWSALMMGDPTAKEQGRLTLNPLKHIDPFGTILLPLLLLAVSYLSGGHVPVFGYAKPVPVNHHRFRRQKIGLAVVSSAGPLSNLGLAFLSVLFLVFFHPADQWEIVFMHIFNLNWLLAIFNLLPIPPLDGSRIVSGLLPREVAERYNRLAGVGFILIILLLQTRFIDWLYFKSLEWLSFLIQALVRH